MAQLFLLGSRGRLDHRRGVAVLDRLAALRHVVEEREELIVLFLSKRVVLVAVTASAAQRHAEPDRRRCINAVDDVLDGILLGDNAALGIAAVVAIEAGSDSLFECGMG